MKTIHLRVIGLNDSHNGSILRVSQFIYAYTVRRTWHQIKNNEYKRLNRFIANVTFVSAFNKTGGRPIDQSTADVVSFMNRSFEQYFEVASKL